MRTDTRFGSYMRELRQQAGISCSELGFRLRLTVAAISNIELGQRPPPDYKRIASIGAALGCTHEQIRHLASLGREEREKRVRSASAADLGRVASWLRHRGQDALAQELQTGLWEAQLADFEAQPLADFGGADLDLEEGDHDAPPAAD